MDISDILQSLKKLNKKLKNEGFVIDGVFGSYARNEQNINSDIDILYHLDNVFFTNYSGFIGFKRIDEIKQIISKELNKNVDLAPINNLSNTARKYILDEVIYV